MKCATLAHYSDNIINCVCLLHYLSGGTASDFIIFLSAACPAINHLIPVIESLVPAVARTNGPIISA
ncbi:hypothetical protein Ndes2526B_g03750 [Nannochloris sp. 'desiccata']